jgi:hypothetical protein
MPPTSNASRKPPVVSHASELLAINWGSHIPPLSGLITLLQQVTEPRETLYPDPLITKNSQRETDTPRGNECPALPRLPQKPPQVSTPETLQIGPPSFLWRLHYVGIVHYVISHWGAVQLSAPLSANLLVMWLALLVTSPSWGHPGPPPPACQPSQ